MAFYRKWRPQKFSDVCGQDHIKKILENSLMDRMVTHAYLFCGPRGTGKTTMARLLAKSLNCEKIDFRSKDKNGLFEPCNECPSCLEIAAGQSLDVIEIDAASNRGIEEIRELREKVKFAPVRAPFKVFIIDEVHMLTREAFNALLKTLEEPPKHVIFILATTEPHKILPTIISRCQRYDFHKGNLPEISSNLKQVAKAEKLKIDEDAVSLIARLADGSFRDALSLLDQIASVAGTKKAITRDEVQQALGVANEESVKEFFVYLEQGNVTGIVDLLGKITDSGGDMVAFSNQLIDRARRMILIRSGVDKSVVANDWIDEEWISWANIAMRYSATELMILLNEVVANIGEIKRSPIQQMPLEIAAIGWMQQFSKIQDEGKKVVIVHEEVVKVHEEPVKMQDLIKVSTEEVAPVNVDAVSQSDDVKVEAPPEGYESVWVQVIEKVKPQNHPLFSLLKDAHLKSIDHEKAVVGVRFRFHSERMYDMKNRKIIEMAIEGVCGKMLRLECVIDENIPKPELVHEKDMMDSAVEVFGMAE